MRTRRSSGNTRNEPPILLVKWYDVTKWLLKRVDSFPKNQRFIFGQQIADRALCSGLTVALRHAARPKRKRHYQPVLPWWFTASAPRPESPQASRAGEGRK